ncbi:MAG: potassium transporter Kup, partial [Aeriscardovia aeriphila]|nr:potassium transporter Kup [Aeriscardovia aeriphila]
FTREYSVENFGTDFLFRVRIRIGFKVSQNVATYLHQIMHDLIDSGELPEQRTIYPKIDEDQQIGTIDYVLIHKDLVPESKIDVTGAFALRMKYAIRHVCGNPVKWFGLSAYNPVTESQPLFVAVQPVAPLKRTQLRKVKHPVTLQSVLAKQEKERVQRERQISEEEALEAARAVAHKVHEARKAAEEAASTAKAVAAKPAATAKSAPSKPAAAKPAAKAGAKASSTTKAADSTKLAGQEKTSDK